MLRKHAVNSFLLASLAFAAYSVTFGHSILTSWDDQGYVLLNKSIRDLSFANIITAFSSFYVGNYAPLHIISYMIDHALWGLNPAGYHIENTLIHALNGILFYLILIRLETPKAYAFLASSLFLLHPVQVESVAWVSQRKNVLSMLFFLCAWHSHMTYRRTEYLPSAWYSLTLIMLLCALLTKSVTVIFPLAMLLHDFCFPNHNHARTAWADKIPYILIALAAAVAALISQGPEYGGGRRDYPGGTVLTAAYTMLPVLASYLKDLVWPLGLQPYYMVPIRSAVDLQVILSTILMLGLLWTAVLLWRRHRRLFFFYAFFFLALAPVSQIVPIITLKNDRYLYFPMIGASLLAAEVVRALFGTSAARGKVAAVILLAAMLPLPFITYRLAGIWKNDGEMWSYTISRDPGNMMGWLQMAKWHTDHRNFSEASAAVDTYMRIQQQNGPIWGYHD